MRSPARPPGAHSSVARLLRRAPSTRARWRKPNKPQILSAVVRRSKSPVDDARLRRQASSQSVLHSRPGQPGFSQIFARPTCANFSFSLFACSFPHLFPPKAAPATPNRPSPSCSLTITSKSASPVTTAPAATPTPAPSLLAPQLDLLDVPGPGVITHIWITIASPEELHLKKLVLRMTWDKESTPSVETPIGDFFGLGLGEYFLYQSTPLMVASDKALNSFFPMPFQKHAHIAVTNEGKEKVDAFYYNIDYRACAKPLPADTLYFHAQYRQQSPNKGWTSDWSSNGDDLVNNKKNLDGHDNYVWLEAAGRGHFVGVTMSVLQNQDGWWGEGDDMFFVDGESLPSINGTGSEDYFLGAWDFGSHPFSYALMGAPVKGAEFAGGRSSRLPFPS